MTFEELHEQLRQELDRRVSAGLITGSALARQAGFQQAHISNFLHRRRSLSLEGLDRVMRAQKLTVEQLMPLELAASDGGAETMATIPVVLPATAMSEGTIRPEVTLETLELPAGRLMEMRSRPAARQAGWQRFVAVRQDRQETGAMAPVIGPGATVVLDRHYSSLAPYRDSQPTMYAVRRGNGLALRYVELEDGRLVLRPLSMEFPVQFVPLGERESPGDYIVGRVCLVVSEV